MALVVAVLFIVALVGALSQTQPLVSGTLSFSGGISRGPIAETHVQLTFVPAAKSTEQSHVLTDSRGRFSIRLHPGRYKIVIAGPGAMAFSNGGPMQPQPNSIVVSSSGPNVFPLFIEGI
jgi:hypothetical protein